MRHVDRKLSTGGAAKGNRFHKIPTVMAGCIYLTYYNDQIKDLNYYYKALDPDYKKFLGKKKYLEISNNLITKVIGEQKDVFSVTPQPLITDMYRLNKYENAYLCKLSTKNSEDEAYIGIILDTEKTKYNIFYID